MSSDPTTVALFRFTESDDDVLPSDAVGNVDDLNGDASSTPALAIATVTSGLLGNARTFTTDQALVADELETDSLRLDRDCTIAALVSYDIASAGAGDDSVICARGVSGSAAERTLFGLKVTKLDATRARIALLWEESGGAEASVPGAAFVVPSGWLLVWATRRWISPTEVIVRYGINGQRVSESTSADGDIGNGADGTFTVGCRGDGSGNYQDFWIGDIDQLWISDGARSDEELAAVYRRITEHQPGGYDIVRALAPRRSYSTDADSVVQRELMAEGDAIGRAVAKSLELEEDGLPDRAWSTLASWERIAGFVPAVTDGYDKRRARLLSFFSGVNGYSEAGIKAAVAESFGQAAADVELLTYSNEWTDDFTTAQEAFWQSLAGAGAIAIDTDRIKLSVATATDAQFDSDNAVILRHPIDYDALLDSDLAAITGVAFTVKLASITLAQECAAGIMLYGIGPLRAVWYGYYNRAGTTEIAYRQYEDGAWGAFTAIQSPAPALPTWLRILEDSGFEADDSQLGPTTGYGSGTSIPGSTDGYRNAALVLFSDIASPSGASEAIFDDWVAYMPQGLRTFCWYAYRDSTVSGSYDLDAARRVVENIKPADSHASAVDVTAIVCDTDGSFCDDGPIA